MTSTLDERRLGDLPWIVARGTSPDVFHALGGHLRDAITGYLADTPLLPRLRRHVARGPGAPGGVSSPGSGTLDWVRNACRETFPEVWAELAALADGAGVPFDDVLLLNLRGDLGPVGAGHGCSDLAWRRRTSVIAHNEDGAAFDLGRCRLLTLNIEGAPTVTGFWYPGMLASNAFTVTEHGLVWTIDSLTAKRPGAHPGRHFVARALQRAARTLDEAAAFLAAHPSAGGFTYNLGETANLGDTAGRVLSVDTIAGRCGGVEVGVGGGPLAWHTNHPRYLPAADFATGESSTRRGSVLDGIAPPAGEPDANWFLRYLAGGTHPDGVFVAPDAAHAPGSAAGEHGATLCTFVAELTAAEAVVRVPGGRPVAIPLSDLATGDPARQRVLDRRRP